MSEYSYATERKIRKIKERLGEDWKTQLAGRSIDAVYNEIVGDTRKNLFCKVDAGVKEKLDDMVHHYRTQMAEFIEILIEAEWARHQTRMIEAEQGILEKYNGST